MASVLALRRRNDSGRPRGPSCAGAMPGKLQPALSRLRVPAGLLRLPRRSGVIRQTRPTPRRGGSLAFPRGFGVRLCSGAFGVCLALACGLAALAPVLPKRRSSAALQNAGARWVCSRCVGVALACGGERRAARKKYPRHPERSGGFAQRSRRMTRDGGSSRQKSRPCVRSLRMAGWDNAFHAIARAHYASRRSQVMRRAWRLLQGLGSGAGVGFAGEGTKCRWSGPSW